MRDDRLADTVTDSVGFTLAGALAGYAVVFALEKTTPLRPPWWLGVALGAAFGSAANWDKENRPQ